MGTNSTRYPAEVRERAVRLVLDHQGEYGSQWGAIDSISAKIGCTAETPRRWVRQAERDEGVRRFEEWLALFADDGRYWIPSQPGQTDAITVPSIIYEDRPLLTIRVKRLMHPNAYAVLPTPRTLHIVGNMEIRDHDEATDQFRVACNLAVVQHQQATTLTFAGHCEHILRRSDDGFSIALKRIDLIDCDAVHGIMTALL